MKKWEIKILSAAILSGIFTLTLIYFSVEPLFIWALGILTGIIISHIPINEV